MWAALLIGAVLLAVVVHRNSTRLEWREKQMLKTSLRKLGVDPRVFSEACLTELVEIGTRSHRELLSKTEYVRRLPTNIFGIATVVQWICMGIEDAAAAKMKAEAEKNGYPNCYWEILAKHDPKRFGVDELEHTQSINQMVQTELKSN